MPRTRPHARPAFALAALLALAATPDPAPAAEPFVYQGRLTDNAQPADGLYDLKLDYYTAATAGASVLTTTLDDVTVSRGVFSVSLPFPPTTDARWLAVSVRPGASTGAYTAMTPRQFIAAAPVASFALNAPWRLDASTMSYGDGDDAVLINRASPLPDEHFGVHSTEPGFGGMYVSVDTTASYPFYAYAIGGDLKAYHYYTAGNNAWYLAVNGQDRLFINSTTARFQTVTVTAPDFAYESVRQHTLSISGNTFVGVSGDAFRAYTSGGNGLYTTSTDGLAWFTAPVALPDGALITQFRAYIVDNATGASVDVLLVGDEMITGTNFAIASLSSSGLANSSVPRELSASPAHVVDNARYAYFAVALFNNAPGTNTLRLGGVRILYTVARPD